MSPHRVFLLLLGVVSAGCGRQEVHPWVDATPVPDRIALTFAGDPATALTVTWRTDSSVSEAYAELAYAGASPEFARQAKLVPARTEVLDLHDAMVNLVRPSPVHYHRVEFDGLHPDTLYAYRVRGAEWSEWYQFRTAPTAGPFSFLYFGDAQNDILSHWSRVIRAAHGVAPDARFALHAGDLVNSAHLDTDWAEWFRAAGWINGMLPLLPVAGNHEYAPYEVTLEPDGGPVAGPPRLALQWRPQFGLPRHDELPRLADGTVYTLVFQDLRVVVLNSNGELELQAVWLDDLLARSGERWTVVAFHHPVFSSGSERDNPELRAIWEPVLRRHAVDLVLQGHDHTYARGRATEPRLPVAEPVAGAAGLGTVYVTSVSGAKMYPFRSDGWDGYAGAVLDRTGEAMQFFQVVGIDGNRLSYAAYTAAGERFDAFEIRKDQAGRKVLAGAGRMAGDEP